MTRAVASRSAGPGAAALLLAALALLAPPPARADGLPFLGDLPDAPHVLLDLAAEQQAALARAARRGEAWPQLLLTPAQRKALRAQAGVEPRWVFAVAREVVEGECPDGTYNLGVVAGAKLAVLREGLGDHLGARDVAALEQSLVDGGLARRAAADPSAPAPVAGLVRWRDGEPAPEALASLAARFPAAGPGGTLRLGQGKRQGTTARWRAERLRLAAVPRLDPAGGDPLAPLHALAAVAGTPASPVVLRWPELGARLEADGADLRLVPGLEVAEVGPPARAWFLLEYRGGRLARAVALAGGWWTGVTYEPEGPEPGGG